MDPRVGPPQSIVLLHLVVQVLLLCCLRLGQDRCRSDLHLDGLVYRCCDLLAQLYIAMCFVSYLLTATFLLRNLTDCST